MYKSVADLVTSVSLKMVNESHCDPKGRMLICEDVEGKNINRAEKFIKEKHPEVIGQKLQDGTTITPRILTQEIRNSFKNSRGPVVNGKNTCKFLLGVTRIYFDDLQKDSASFQRKCSQLDNYLGIINAAHADEYDQNLNGLSFDELHNRFASAAKTNLDSDIEKIKGGTYKKNDSYEIVPIDSFEEAQEYGKYTSWCITRYDNMYDNYTHGGLGRFYFCLKKGFENLKAEKGEGCPLDEYGKSMIAISVNEDGSLNTCTCRWNHDNGGDDNMMDTKNISEFFGVNFYETFKPRGVDEIWEKLKEQDEPNHFSKTMGWIRIFDDDSENNVTNPVYCVREGDKIVKYLDVIASHPGNKFPYSCIAKDKFYWYDMDGNRIDVPAMTLPGGFNVESWSQLVSLEGIPTSTTNGISITHCKNLKDISALKTVKNLGTGGLGLTGCELVDGGMIEDVLSNNKNLIIGLAAGAKDVKIEDGMLTYKIPFDDLEQLWSDTYRDDVSFETCKKIMNGESDFYYDGLEVSDWNDGDFDNVMKNNDIDLAWTDIKKIYDGEASAEEFEEKGISEEQFDRIYEMTQDDFYDGMGLYTVYSDCYRWGCEKEACDSIMSAVEYVVPMKGDASDNYDGSNVTVSFVLDEKFTRMVKTIWTDENYAEAVDSCTGGLDLIYAHNWNPDDGDFDKISVTEPQYGWDGFDDENWKNATRQFAFRVVKMLTGHDPVEQQQED